tara:strand:- start:4494 stop:4829 length:336 start_codon:yes stop_codon:yes gene_type:complete
MGGEFPQVLVTKREDSRNPGQFLPSAVTWVKGRDMPGASAFELSIALEEAAILARAWDAEPVLICKVFIEGEPTERCPVPAAAGMAYAELVYRDAGRAGQVWQYRMEEPVA